MHPEYQLNNTDHKLTLLRREHNRTWLAVNDEPIELRLEWINKHDGHIELQGQRHRFSIAQNDKQLFVHIFGATWNLTKRDGFSLAEDTGEHSGAISAPMPGVVVENYVTLGQPVEKDEPVLLIESMKLQTELQASDSGVISAVKCYDGESFEKGSILIEITPHDTGSSEEDQCAE